MPPHWYVSRTPHPTNALPESTLEKGCKPLGFVAHSVFLRSSIGSTTCRQSSPGAAHLGVARRRGDCRRHRTIQRKSFSSSSGSREYPSAAAQRTPCCSRNLASRSCASHSTFVPSHLPKDPACLRCVAQAAAVGRELKGMSYRLRFGPQGWESMALRFADSSNTPPNPPTNFHPDLIATILQKFLP